MSMMTMMMISGSFRHELHSELLVYIYNTILKNILLKESFEHPTGRAALPKSLLSK